MFSTFGTGANIYGMTFPTWSMEKHKHTDTSIVCPAVAQYRPCIEGDSNCKKLLESVCV